MTRKPNLAKCLLGVVTLAFLFIVTMAITTAPRSTAQQKPGPQAKPTPTPTPTPTPSPSPTPPSAIDHVFEIEGNSVNGSADGTDWNDVNPPTNPAVPPGFVTGPFGGAQIATFVLDPDGASIFTTGGSKDHKDITEWVYSNGSVPDKDEIQHAYAAIFIDNTGVECTAPDVPAGCNPTFGHRVLVFGGDREATEGDANIGFWFFKSPVGLVPIPDGAPANTNAGFTGHHEIGDLFVVSAFTGGGGTSTVAVYEWVGPDDPSTPNEENADNCAALNGTLDPSGDATMCRLPATAQKGKAFVNPQNLVPPDGLDWPYTAKGDKTPCTNTPVNAGNGPTCEAETGSFYEGGLDLTAIGLGGTCFSTFLLETRSSAEIDAVLKDFALGSFFTCSCSVTPASQSVCDGATAQFCAVDPQGAPGPFTYKWDTGETTQCITTGVAGTHSVEITDSLGNKTTCEGTLTVNPSPTPSVTVDTSCADQITLTASGGTEFNWDGQGFSTTATLVVGTGPSTHTVVVKNAAGCTASKTVHVGLCCRDCDGITP